jgi:hypothetical protein
MVSEEWKMTPFDALKALVDLGAATLLVFWVAPVTIYFAAFVSCAVILAGDTAPLDIIIDLSWSQRIAVVAGIGLGLGSVLAAIQTFLYNLLSGYVLPIGLVRRLVYRQVQQRRKLIARYQSSSRVSIKSHSLLRERLDRFPTDEAQIAPTGFGNAIRAMETYSWEHFRLDVAFFSRNSLQ